MTVQVAADCCRAKFGHCHLGPGCRALFCRLQSLTTLHPIRLNPWLSKLQEHPKSAIQYRAPAAGVPQRKVHTCHSKSRRMPTPHQSWCTIGAAHQSGSCLPEVELTEAETARATRAQVTHAILCQSHWLPPHAMVLPPRYYLVSNYLLVNDSVLHLYSLQSQHLHDCDAHSAHKPTRKEGPQ